MSVGRICARNVDVAQPEETAQVAARRMHSRSVGTLVVVSSSEEPIGILTDRDLTVRIVAEGRDPLATPIEEIMTRDPRTVNEDEPIESALAVMRAGPFRRVLVTDESGKLVGLLSMDDILSLLRQELNDIGELLHKESPQSLAEL